MLILASFFCITRKNKAMGLAHLIFFFIFAIIKSSDCRSFGPDPTTPSGLERSPLVNLQAVVGGNALLPCNITPTDNDVPILVLFFYGEKGTPIYSVDGRGGHVFHGYHWSDPDQLGDRANVTVVGPYEGMSLNRLVREDGGEYRCRVDFRTSPTRNMRINLNIIVPPRHLLVKSSWDKGRIVTGTAGPYPEGAEVTLSCQVTGGQPRPTVNWWQGDNLVDSHCEEKTEQITRNSFRLPRLTRRDLLRNFTCIAQNNNLTEALSRLVTIDIAFPPTSVTITLKMSATEKPATESRPLIREHLDFNDGLRQPDIFKMSGRVITLPAEKEAIILCESMGSRPQALLVWKKNGQPIDGSTSFSNTLPTVSTKVSLSSTSSVSQSMLTFIPRFTDHRVVLGCQAVNKNLPKETIQDQVTLNVLYRPQISIRYESEHARAKLKEGDEFAFICEVHANPMEGKIQWSREGIPILSNTTAEISIYDKRLVLHRASREMSGQYTCAAANSEGVNTSEPIGVRIKFAPVCSKVQQLQYGAGKNEEVSVTCTVESYPEPTGFNWAFSRSSEVEEMSQNSFTMAGFSSSLQYFPKSEADFGSLLCWARNNIGPMVDPCIIRIVPAAKPDTVRHCEVINNSSMPSSSAIVSCTPGWDGGLQQTFTLEVRESKNKHSRILASVLHSPIPDFHLRNLKPREHYLFIITAANTRGTSPPVTVSYITPIKQVSSLASNAHTSDKTTWISWTSFVAVIFGVMLTVLACLCAVIGLMKFKNPPPHPSTLHSNSVKHSEAKIVYSGTSGSTSLEQEKLSCDFNKQNLRPCNEYMYGIADNSKDMNCPDVSCSESCSNQILTSIGDREVNFRSSGSDVRIHDQIPCSDIHCSALYEDHGVRNESAQSHSYQHINSVSLILKNI